jgi:hypothetical protein
VPEQDLHLAKRFYDKTLEVQPDAAVPVRLALASLQLHTWCLPFFHTPAADSGHCPASHWWSPCPAACEVWGIAAMQVGAAAAAHAGLAALAVQPAVQRQRPRARLRGAPTIPNNSVVQNRPFHLAITSMSWARLLCMWQHAHTCVCAQT